MTKPFIIGVSGGSGSGKTTFSRLLEKVLGPERCGVLRQDSYYIDQSNNFSGDGTVNFDHPESLEFSLMAEHLKNIKAGQSINIPIYDFSTHKRSQHTDKLTAREVIIVDGILILTQPSVRAAMDLKIFVDCCETARFERRLERDVRERGRTPEGVRTQFETHVKPMHDQFVEPSKSFADEVISGEAPFDAWVKKVLALIQ